MQPRSNIEYDLSGLSRLVSTLEGALFGRGEEGDLGLLLRIEGGQLAADISADLGPATLEQGTAKVEKDVKHFLTTRPAYSNLSEEQQYSSVSDFTWLQAGPSFLVGINDEDNQTGASADDALTFFRGSQKAGSRGKAYVEIGTRGKQHIYRLNRTRVSKSALRSVVNIISGKIGSLRASFAFTAAQLLPAKRLPAWISRHFATKANGRAIFNDAGLNHPDAPFLEFGSTAPGVEGNPRITEAIHGNIERRKVILDQKLKKVLAGYAYDWNSGRVFHQREAKEE